MDHTTTSPIYTIWPKMYFRLNSRYYKVMTLKKEEMVQHDMKPSSTDKHIS